MKNVKKFTPSYLKHKKYDYGVICALSSVAICFIASLFYWDQTSVASTLLAASPEMVFEKGEYWRLFSSTFIHADLDHFLSNSLMLAFLSYFVSAFYGIAILIFSFFMGTVINIITLARYEQEITLVGASGVVYFLWGLWLMLYLFIEKRLPFYQRLMRVIALFLVLLIPTTYSPQTSYFAHYIGFTLGLVCAGVYYLMSPKRASKEEVQSELNHVNEESVDELEFGEDEEEWLEEEFDWRER